jgi:hypothetical protein
MLGKRTTTATATTVPMALIALAAMAGLAILAASPAQAEVYHVKLKNGTTIDTAYQPQQAPWEPNIVVLLTDAGNWIGIQQKDVDSVQTESEIRGFGIALNFNTVAIGWAPNDAAEPTAPTAQSATMQALQNIYQQQQSESHYTIPQFVNAEQTQGIPSAFIGGGRVPQVPPPAPPPMPVTIPSPAPATPGSQQQQ